MRVRAVVFAGVLGFFVVATTASASSITWGAPTTISGDTDVSTAGTFVGAVDVGPSGGSPVTVNGVVFSPIAFTGASATSGDFTFSSVSGLDGANQPTTTAPFGALSVSYQSMLSTIGGANGLFDPPVLTLNNLTPGDTYQFEWWVADPSDFIPTTTATAGNAVTLQANVTGLVGGLGQFAIGTFIADASASEVITFSGGLEPSLSGAELRCETVNGVPCAAASTVPEPASMLLLGTGLIGVGARRLRQRHAVR